MTTTRFPASAETIEAIIAAVHLGLEPLRARPPMRLSVWAARHFMMAGESSHQRGAWAAWPFQPAILDWMADDDIEELDVFKAKRIGYTKMLTASLGYEAAWRRRNQALWQPTDDDRDSYVKSEVDPMMDSVVAVREARASGARAEDTIKFKCFRGSVLHLLGGKAARAYRRITVASAKLDEIDGFDRRVEKSADPVTLARGRLEGAPFPKLIVGSTPRKKGLSHIEDRAALAEAHMRFNIACPQCGVEHPLVWGGRKRAFGLKWSDDDPATAHHVCPHCRDSIRQADYLRVWERGRWICERTGIWYDHRAGTWHEADGSPRKAPRHVAAYPWAANSPQRDWADIVREYLAAEQKLNAGDSGPMEGFTNETLGEVYAEEAEQSDQSALKARREAYALGTVPVGCLVLTCFVDVQDNYFHLLVRGFGRGMESWIVDRRKFDANPADEADWAKLDSYLTSRYRQAWHGGTLGIECAAIDTGGHFTHQVYNFVRAREYRRIYGTKGDSIPGKPIKSPARKQDVNYRGAVIKNGVKLWYIGTDTAKDLIHGRLGLEPPDPGQARPGYVHVPVALGEGEHHDFFDQLTAEGRVLQKTATGHNYRWVPIRKRNEDLDCMVGTEWCAELLGLSQYTDAMWDRLEAAVQPPRDLFAPRDQEGAAEPELAIPPAVVAQRERQQLNRTAGRPAGREW